MGNWRQYDTAGSRRENPLDPPTLLSATLQVSVIGHFETERRERESLWSKPLYFLPYEACRRRHISSYTNLQSFYTSTIDD